MTPQPVLRCASDGRGSVPFFWKAVKETGLRDDGLLTSVGNYTITRDAQNGLPTNVAGGALSLSRTFNGYGEVSAQTATVNGVAAGTLNLTYDDNGQIVTKSETVNGVTANYAYTYDAQGRLLTVQKDGTLVEEYRYNDPIHPGLRTYEMNLLRGISGRSLTYNSEDQLQSNVASTFHYDADGNVDQVSGSWGTAALTYSTRGELLSVTMPGGSTVISYIYDPLGRRIAKKVNGATVEKYLWSGLTTLLAVYDGIDNLVMRFEYADGRMPVSMTRGGATYYLSYDQVGTLRAVYDSTGAIVKRIDYDTFGNVLDDSNPGFAMPFGFAGGLRDSDTDLVHFGYRDYSPETGRWFQKDPIGFAGGDVNLYGYCLDDPVNFVDPMGKNVWLVRFAIGALAGIAEEMLFEMWDNFQNGRSWDCFDWGQIGLAGLFGGLTSAGLGGLGAKIGGKLKGLLGNWLRGGRGARFGNVFQSGDIIVKEMATSKGTLEMAAEVVINGKTLHLKDVAVFPRGVQSFELGAKEIIALRDQLAAEARAMGYDYLRITGKRLTGANPGKLVDIIIDLTQ